jgi:hypothetical protein
MLDHMGKDFRKDVKKKKPPDIGFSDRNLKTARHGAEFCPLAAEV